MMPNYWSLGVLSLQYAIDTIFLKVRISILLYEQFWNHLCTVAFICAYVFMTLVQFNSYETKRF